MIGANSVDRYTNTVADAAEFERLRGGSYYDEVDLPGPHDLIDDRPEPSPYPATSLAASALSMTLVDSFGPGVEVTVIREGILALTSREPMSRASLMVTLQGHYGDRAEVVEKDGTVWVRLLRTAFGDPFVVDGVENDEPPF